MTHSGKQSTTITVGLKDTDEILNSYGVFELNFDGILCNIPIVGGFCTMDRIFANPKGDSVLISVDVERTGEDDLLILTNTELFYIDDLLTNEQAEIVATSDAFNPCIDSGNIKINSTMLIQFKVIDDNRAPDNIVTARAIIYADDPNEQDTGFVNNTAGSTFTFTNTKDGNPLIYNKTTNNGKIRLEAFDPINFPTSSDTVTAGFTVGVNGVEFNDCTSDLVISPFDEAVINATQQRLNEVLDTDITNNAIFNALDTLKGLTGLGGSLLFLIIMMTVIIGIWCAKKTDADASSTFGVVILAMVLLMIIGFFVGAINLGILLTLIVTGIIIVSLFVVKFVMNPSTR